MAYKIVSGKYECGTREQQEGYEQLFGSDNIQYKFDLYFHWYNLVHEFGHCLLDFRKASMTPVQEEMYVNQFAVSYWRYVGCEDKIEELKELLEGIITNIPSPVPEKMSFTEYFESIWGTELLNNVMIYGYFQLNSVLEMIKTGKGFADTLQQIGIEIEGSHVLEKYAGEISSEDGYSVLENVYRNLKILQIECPKVGLELVENPLIRRAGY